MVNPKYTYKTLEQVDGKPADYELLVYREGNIRGVEYKVCAVNNFATDGVPDGIRFVLMVDFPYNWKPGNHELNCDAIQNTMVLMLTSDEIQSEIFIHGIEYITTKDKIVDRTPKGWVFTDCGFTIDWFACNSRAYYKI